jgi:hypothetical protein
MFLVSGLLSLCRSVPYAIFGRTGTPILTPSAEAAAASLQVASWEYEVLDRCTVEAVADAEAGETTASEGDVHCQVASEEYEVLDRCAVEAVAAAEAGGTTANEGAHEPSPALEGYIASLGASEAV